MRFFSRLAFFVVLLTMLAFHARAAQFQAGAYAIDVTPTNFPVQLSGGILPVLSTHVMDPLHARCLVLDDGQTRIGISILDNCLVQREYADEAREAMSRASGIPANRLTLACTHNHSSPALMNCHGAIMETNYARWLLPRLAEGMKQAAARLQPARVGWAVTSTWEHSFNRRWVRRPDRIVTDPFGKPTARVQMNPGHESPDVIGPAGPKDPDLMLLAVETPDGIPIAVLANFANHYFGVSGAVVSADYFSRFGDRLRELLAAQGRFRGKEAGFVGMMSQGPSGDINRFNFAAPRSRVTMDEYALQMAELAVAAYRTIRFHDWVPLEMRHRDLPMATRYPDAERLAWAVETVARLEGRPPKTLSDVYAIQQLWLDANKTRVTPLQALRVGELGIVMAAAEVYAISGLKIKAQSPLQPAFWITLANGNDGYIPPPEHMLLGGYTTWPTRTSSLETQAEPVIVETLLRMLEEISGRPRRPGTIPNGPYAETVLKKRPFAYWRLDDFDTNHVADTSGHGRDAILNGGTCHYLPGIEPGTGFTTVKPRFPNPFSGNAINRAVHLVDGNLTADLSDLPGNDWSVELWFWNGLPASARGTTAELVRMGGEMIGLSGTNATPGLLFYAPPATDVSVAGKMEVPLRSWCYLVFVKQGNRRMVYLNGAPAIQHELTGRPAAEDPLQLIIGGLPGSNSSLEGKLDEVAVYPRALKAEEIETHYRFLER